MKCLALVVVLALGVGGCVGKSSVTEGDRQLAHQNAEAARFILGMVAAVSGLPGPGAAEAIAAVQDIEANANQQLANWGSPNEPMPYSAENSKKARDQAKKEHESGGLGGTLLGVGGVLVGIASTLAGYPMLAAKFPAIAGFIGKAATTGATIIAKARQVYEAKGWNEQAKELIKIAHEENVAAGIQKKVVPFVDKIEEKLGLDLQVKLQQPPTEGAAT